MKIGVSVKDCYSGGKSTHATMEGEKCQHYMNKSLNVLFVHLAQMKKIKMKKKFLILTWVYCLYSSTPLVFNRPTFDWLHCTASQNESQITNWWRDSEHTAIQYFSSSFLEAWSTSLSTENLYEDSFPSTSPSPSSPSITLMLFKKKKEVQKWNVPLASSLQHLTWFKPQWLQIPQTFALFHVFITMFWHLSSAQVAMSWLQ